MRFCLRLALLTLLLFAASLATYAAERIVVGSKIDTEGALLGNMIVLLLRHDGFVVESRLQLGPTKIVRAAILAGQIDIYPEYSGNGATFFHAESDPVWRDAALGYAKISELDRHANRLIWLQPAPVSNTWAIVVTRELVREHQLGDMAGLAAYVNAGGRIRLAASAEFVESPAALPAFQSAYGFSLSDDQLLVLSGGDTAATIRIAAEHMSGVNAAMAYATDGAVKALNLSVLTDSRHAQTVYEPAPVIREAVLERNPQLRRSLDAAFGALSLETLQTLNARISVDGEDAAEVAASYLHEQRLLP